jgi:hypothetical protein
MNNPLVEKSRTRARARGTTTRASRAQRCTAVANDITRARRFQKRSVVQRPRGRTTAPAALGVHLTTPTGGFFCRGRKQQNSEPARVHGRNARTLMRVDRRILDIERHFREVRSRLDASLSVRDRYARHARQRGGAVNDLLVGVLVHHRETMF